MSGYYPAELTDWSPNAPWNEPGDPPEKDFDVTCSQTLSKTVVVTTNNYIPGASGVDYDNDDEGGYYASAWHDPDDTSDTNWDEEYDESGHYTPLQLIQMYQETLKKQLESYEGMEDSSFATKMEARKIAHLIEECEGWSDDETEYVEE